MDEHEVTELYMKYIRALREKSRPHRGCLSNAVFASSPSGTTIFHDRDELVNGFASLQDTLDVDGYVGSRINHLKFSSIAKTTGTLHVDFDRMDAEGARLTSTDRHCICFRSQKAVSRSSALLFWTARPSRIGRLTTQRSIWNNLAVTTVPFVRMPVQGPLLYFVRYS